MNPRNILLNIRQEQLDLIPSTAMRRRGYPSMHGGRRGPSTTGSREGVPPSTLGARGGKFADGWQQWNKWKPGTKCDDRWSNIDEEEERNTYEKSDAQGRVQSSHEVCSNPDGKHRGTQTIKIEESEDDKPSANANKKARRAKPRFRLGKRDRALEKEKRDTEQRDQASSALEVPLPTADDEGSSSRCTILL